MFGAPAKTRVVHPLHGTGVIHGWRRGGRRAVVSFDNHPLPIEVASRDLGVDGVAEDGAARDRAAAGLLPQALDTAYEGSFDRAEAILTLEAMRLGVVPTARLDAYTVGRDFELELVDNDLTHAREKGGALRAFLGDYGVGKTHLLELVQQRALANNFLAARVVLDPTETSPAQPKRVYRSAIRTLRYPDRPTEENAGIAPLLEAAVASEEALAQFGLDQHGKPGRSPASHLYLSAALSFAASLGRVDKHPPRGVAAGDLSAWSERSHELLVDWLEGHPTISNQVIDQELSRLPGRQPKLYSLLDFRPWSRIYGYLLSGLSALARSVGYAGLVVVLDEAEFYGLLSPANRAYARDLFKAWAWAAVGADAGLPFGEDDLGVGGYGVQRTLPARFGDSPGLYIVFAMTPHGDGVSALEGTLPADCITSLRSLEALDYAELARRVCDFYASSRPDWTLPAAAVGPLTKVLKGLIRAGYIQNPRHAMKFLIEFLDVVRYYPKKVGGVVRNLQESLLW